MVTSASAHIIYILNDLTIFPAVRMCLSCSWKQPFAVGSTTEVTQKSFENNQLADRVPSPVRSRDCC